jgi:hypothetical protein
MSDPETAQPQNPVWHEVATHPDILAKEQQLAGIRAVQDQVRRGEGEVTQYYWNTGTPYTTSSESSTRLSYHWDKPTDDPSAGSSPEGQRYLNDPAIDFQSVSPVEGLDVSIGHTADGKQYLVDPDGRVISPGYSSLTHVSGNTFQIPGYQQPESLTLLNDQEREAAREQRAHFERLRGSSEGSRQAAERLQEEVTTAVLQSYGVTPEDVVRQKMGNTTAFEFARGGRYVRLEITEGITRVITWNASISTEERLEAWGAHEDKTDKSVRIGMMDSHLDTTLPEELTPYEDKIIAGMDGLTAEKREFLQHEAALNERTGFLEFAVGSPHPSWSIPIAMSIVDLPPAEAYQLVGHQMRGGTDYVIAPKPGVFEPATDKPIAWRLTPDGTIERIKRDRNYPVDEQIATVVSRIEAERSTAVAGAADYLTVIIRKIIDTL